MTETIKTSPEVKPSAATPGVQVPANVPGIASVDQIKQIFEEIQKIKEAQAAKATPAAQAKPETKQEIDWAKITEADIANLNIPIPVIEQETPEYLTVHLKDKSYIARWIHVMRERLGPCLASGYEYVTEDMLDKNYPHPLLFDANGHYSHGDVVCLRILKERYFGAIKKNYLKTMAIHGRAQNRAKLKEAIQDDEHIGEAFEKQSLEMYTPTDMKGTTYSKDMFDAV